MPILLGKEEPIVVDLNETAQSECENFTMTPADLSEMDGRTASTPVYLAIKGYVYDVSAGREMYGPGKSYHVFVGKDASRAFSNGCMEMSCCVSSLDGLSEDEVKEVDRWEEFYRSHDKYTCVGRLVDSVIDSVVDRELAESDENEPSLESTTT